MAIELIYLHASSHWLSSNSAAKIFLIFGLLTLSRVMWPKVKDKCFNVDKVTVSTSTVGVRWTDTTLLKRSFSIRAANRNNFWNKQDIQARSTYLMKLSIKSM